MPGAIGFWKSQDIEKKARKEKNSKTVTSACTKRDLKSQVDAPSVAKKEINDSNRAMHYVQSTFPRRHQSGRDRTYVGWELVAES